MKMETHAEIVVSRPPETVFDFSTDVSAFEKVLRPLGPIPGVTGVEVPGGGAMVKGTRRLVKLSDGSTMEEEILALERPRVHRYRWCNRPAFPFSLLVAGGETEWTFSAHGTGTKIDWHYTFELTSPLAYPGMLLIRAFFQKWMQQGLTGVRDLLTQ